MKWLCLTQAGTQYHFQEWARQESLALHLKKEPPVSDYVISAATKCEMGLQPGSSVTALVQHLSTITVHGIC